MTRPLDLPLTALEVALAAKAGSLRIDDRLRLATAALAPDVEPEARAIVAAFLDGCARGYVETAGAVLHDWLMSRYPAEAAPAPVFDWQARADLA